MTRQEKYDLFRALHTRPGAFVIPNPWDAGSAKILAALGFESLATTSSGYAFSAGHRDSVPEITRQVVSPQHRSPASCWEFIEENTSSRWWVSHP
jgi:2-methylisocitrate lyase-like PEP mutase family enzyme